MDICCITTRNEEQSIGRLVRALLLYGFEVVVVDDGSSDQTASVAAAEGAIVQGQHPPAGLGPGLMQAWRLALRLGADVIVQMDAGGSHQPYQARMMAQRLRRGGFDVMIGSRFCRGAVYAKGGPSWRPWASRAMTLACNALSGPCTDWTSGFRAFTASAAVDLLDWAYRARMHGWQIETLMYCYQQKMLIGEMPISYIPGRSSFNRRVAREALQVWTRMATGRF